jgi:hypothetical protein
MRDVPSATNVRVTMLNGVPHEAIFICKIASVNFLEPGRSLI